MKILTRGFRTVIPSSTGLYSKLPIHNYHDEEGSLLLNPQPDSVVDSYELEEKAAKPSRATRVLPFRRIWTKNVLCTLLAQAFFDFQMG